MTTKTINLRESRDMGEVLRDTFVFMRVMLKPFLRCVLPIAGPFLIVAALLFFAMTIIRNPSSVDIVDITNGQSPLFFVALGATIGFALSFALSYLMLFASGSVFMVLYARHGSQVPTPTEVWQHTKKNLFRLIGTGILASVITALSAIFFLLPGIYVAVALWIIFIVRLQEDVNISDAVSRCFDLVKGYWWRTLVIFLVLQLFSAAIDYALELPIEVLDIIAPAAVIGDSAYTIITVLIKSTTLVLSILTYIPLVIAPAIHYYNLVERKEAVGLQEKIYSITNDEGQEYREA